MGKGGEGCKAMSWFGGVCKPSRTFEVGQFVGAVRNLDREQPERVVQLLRRTFVELVHKLVAANGSSAGTTKMLSLRLGTGPTGDGRLNTQRGQNDGVTKIAVTYQDASHFFRSVMLLVCCLTFSNTALMKSSRAR